jgi:hypothetical protein
VRAGDRRRDACAEEVAAAAVVDGDVERAAGAAYLLGRQVALDGENGARRGLGVHHDHAGLAAVLLGAALVAAALGTLTGAFAQGV